MDWLKEKCEEYSGDILKKEIEALKRENESLNKKMDVIRKTIDQRNLFNFISKLLYMYKH